jgi:hypothetical protein
MGEKSKSIGEKLEGFGENLFSNFGWTELTRDKEINCTRSSHKNKDDEKKKTHGIDLLHTCYDPYRERKLGIVIECKNRQWSGINQSKLNEWLKELINTIDCAQNANELRDFENEGYTLNTGILLINANDNKFEKDKFYEYLVSLEYPSRRNPMNVFIAGNDRIEQWNSLFKTVKNECTEEFKYVYPCIGSSKYTESKYLTVNHMFSKFIFGTQTIYRDEKAWTTSDKPAHIPYKQNYIFSFDVFSPDSFKYVCSLFKHFQFENADEYIFYFYPHKADDIDYVRKYFTQSILGSDNKAMLDRQKVSIRLLENPHINPVDYTIVK